MILFLALVLSQFSTPAGAFCGTYVGSPGVNLTNKTSQVIIARQETRTTLTLANDYEGAAQEFAMLIPVPEILEEDDIKTVRPELFQRFDDYTAPRLVRYECEDFSWDEQMDGDADADADGDVDADAGGAPRVIVEAEYSVGIYEIVILSADESGALLTWLDANGYGVDASAESLLAEYIDSGAYFFAAKVGLQQAGEGEFLEPLQFGYRSDVFSLPIRLGTLNSPGEQDVVMYIVTDEDAGKVGVSNYPQMTIEDECMVDAWNASDMEAHYGERFENAFAQESGAGWLVEYAWATSWCDPCSAEPPSNDELSEAGFEGSSWDSYLTRIRMRYTAEAATQDLTLYASGLKEQEQIRYIAYNASMEDRFPVCGVGMVDDPGTCDDEESGAVDPSNDDETGGSWEPAYQFPEGIDGTPRSERGCSYTDGRSDYFGWLSLCVPFAILRRRRSAA